MISEIIQMLPRNERVCVSKVKSGSSITDENRCPLKHVIKRDHYIHRTQQRQVYILLLVFYPILY